MPRRHTHTHLTPDHTSPNHTTSHLTIHHTSSHSTNETEPTVPTTYWFGSPSRRGQPPPEDGLIRASRSKHCLHVSSGFSSWVEGKAKLFSCSREASRVGLGLRLVEGYGASATLLCQPLVGTASGGRCWATLQAAEQGLMCAKLDRDGRKS